METVVPDVTPPPALSGTAGLRVAYLGNFLPGFQPTPTAPTPFSTECHIALSLESLGCEVLRLQEGTVRATDVAGRAYAFDADLLGWTQTLGLAMSGGTNPERREMLDRLRYLGIPSFGIHLDRWWGLERESSILEEPYFRVDVLATADGGHDEEWKAAGVNHVWSPPAVYHGEAALGTYRRELACDVLFVGSWRHYGHEEWWPVRRAWLDALRRRYGTRFSCWPRGTAVRGQFLNDLLASAKVVVGDSCLSGGITHYCSDRVFEVTGRGGVLVHPRVAGVTDGTLLTEDEHLLCYDLGNHDELIERVDYLLSHETEREALRSRGHEFVKAHHTYRDRLAKVIPMALSANRQAAATIGGR
jgi:Glycosyl transferases group 1